MDNTVVAVAHRNVVLLVQVLIVTEPAVLEAETVRAAVVKVLDVPRVEGREGGQVADEANIDTGEAGGEVNHF